MAVEVRSYSRASGQACDDSVTLMPGHTSPRIAPTRSSCAGLA